MSEIADSAAPASEAELRALGRVFYLRQASAWAAVVWFPAALILVAVDAAGWALGTLVSGAAFSGILRVGVVVHGAERPIRARPADCATCGTRINAVAVVSDGFKTEAIVNKLGDV